MGHVFTSEEDEIILQSVQEIREEGLPVKTAYIKVADELGVPTNSVSGRHKRLLKSLKGEKGSKSLSEADLIILKLKALKRDNERNTEKTDLYKEKYQQLKKDHSTLKKEFSNLQSDYDNLIKTVKSVIGDDLI